MQTWKFTIKPDSDDGFDAFAKCKELGLVGIGWSHGYEEHQPRDYEEAKELIKERWGKSEINEIKKLFFEIQPRDHLWMQKHGHYYLCVAGEKKYIGKEICEDFRRYDLGHAIDAKWIKVPDELVCGSIQRGIIARRMIQKINLSNAEINLNQHIEKKLKEDQNWFPKFNHNLVKERIETIDEQSLFGIMSPDDVEDVVASKLQTEGWILIKSTCFRSKPQFEFSMTNHEGKIGLVQVKSGNWPTNLPPSDYKQYLHEENKIFLFTTHPDPYPGEQIQDIQCILKRELIEWMKNHCPVLSPTIKLKLSL